MMHSMGKKYWLWIARFNFKDEHDEQKEVEMELNQVHNKLVGSPEKNIVNLKLNIVQVKHFKWKQKMET